MDSNGNTQVYFGSGCSSDLGPLAEMELLNWIEDLFHMGYPPEWGSVHTAAVSIARGQGTCTKVVKCTFQTLIINKKTK